jgi:hypothetical protein
MARKVTKVNRTPEEKAALAQQTKERIRAGINKVSMSKESNNIIKNKRLSAEAAELIRREVRELLQTTFLETVQDAADKRLGQFKLQIPEAKGGVRVHDKVYCKFSCEQLLAIFGGWFTLKYAFSSQYTNQDGTVGETDFYICSQDVSMLKQNERPPLNKPLYKAFGVEVYGFAIIAPSTAF